MEQGRVGVWFIGAYGGVATTAATGIAALQNQLAATDGLVSELPRFKRLDLLDWDGITVGGHEIRRTSYAESAAALHRASHVFDTQMLESIADRLAVFDSNILPGVLFNVGQTIAGLADDQTRQWGTAETPQDAVDRVAGDIEQFRTDHRLDRVVVVNLASTEPPPEHDLSGLTWRELETSLAAVDHAHCRASTLYAIAAIKAGCAYVNFTPSIGSDLPAVCELAENSGLPHAGRDGKTGETLMKSVLAPMFAARNLPVMSWVGHNIFGNLDGKVLEDPVNKANKVRSKDRLLTEILGYKPQTLVSIEYIESLGDWKTAWDHIHFRGFLGTPMTLQFIWQGCDSLLAAPLALDLVRFAEFEHRRGGHGVMRHLASFFKSPMGANVPPDFAAQYALLESWADEASG